MKTSVVALFSFNPMYSVKLMSVKVMPHCIDWPGGRMDDSTPHRGEVMAGRGRILPVGKFAK